MEKTNIGGVAKMDNFARFSLVGLEDCPGVAFKVFSLLSRHNVNVDIILQSVGRSGSKDISFTCPLSSLDDARRVLEENKDVLEYDSIEVDDNVAKISLVGAGMMTHVGMASDMFEALYDAGINIQMIATSEIRISVSKYWILSIINQTLSKTKEFPEIESRYFASEEEFRSLLASRQFIKAVILTDVCRYRFYAIPKLCIIAEFFTLHIPLALCPV